MVKKNVPTRTIFDFDDDIINITNIISKLILIFSRCYAAAAAKFRRNPPRKGHCVLRTPNRHIERYSDYSLRRKQIILLPSWLLTWLRTSS